MVRRVSGGVETRRSMHDPQETAAPRMHFELRLGQAADEPDDRLDAAMVVVDHQVLVG